MRTLSESLAERLKDAEFKKEYNRLEPEFAVMQEIIDARAQLGITQAELADRTGIAQGDISRLENGNANPSLKTLQRLAAGVDKRLNIEFVSMDTQ
jgi:predicted transcriptional regulator